MTVATEATAAASVSTDRAGLRVLFVIPGGSAGSSMVFARRQAGGLREEGIQVGLFYLRSRTSPRAVLGEALRFRRRLRAFDPHVVHAHFGTVTAMFAALLAPRRHLVITYRGSDLNRPRHWMPKLERWRAAVGRVFSQLAALRARAIVCVSQPLREQLWWRRTRAVVLPSGVDPAVFFPIPQAQARGQLGWDLTTPVVLFNAGHDPRLKRLDLAQDAVGRARAKLPELRLEVLDGSAQPEQMPLLMNAANCLLLTSETEGSPTVIQEALACNLPVVSVDVGDTAERLRGVRRARLTTRDPRVIGRALAELAATAERSDGVRKLDEFSAANISRQLRRLYESLPGLAAAGR